MAARGRPHLRRRPHPATNPDGATIPGEGAEPPRHLTAVNAPKALPVTAVDYGSRRDGDVYGCQPTTSPTEISRARAIRTSVSSRGLRWSRSILQIASRCSPAATASASCEKPRVRRSRANRWPNVIASSVVDVAEIALARTAPSRPRCVARERVRAVGAGDLQRSRRTSRLRT